MSLEQIPAYLDTHRSLVQAIDGLSQEQVRWKAAPESWSVTEVINHLTDHNIVVSFRIRDILANTTAQLPAFNQDAWVSGQKANESEIGEILEAFRALLQYNSLLFGRLTEKDWEKTGINFKGETVRITDIVAGFIKHVHYHIGQIDRIKQASAAVNHAGAVHL
jgi:uncharacterized damage-inducible protein DinB